MPYLVQKHGTFWFQIHVPKQLVPRYGTFVRECLQTTDRSVAQPLALQLAGQWLARFSAEKLNAATGFEAPVSSSPAASPPDSIAQHTISESNAGVAHATWTGYSYPSQFVIPPQVTPVYGYPQQPSHPLQQPSQQPQTHLQQPHLHNPPPQLPQPQLQPVRSKSAPKTNGEDIKTVDDLLAYWRRLRPEASISTYREFLAVVKDFKKTVRKHPMNLERIDIATYRDKLIADGLARATVSKKISFISALLQTAYDGGLLSQNVARGLRIPKPKIPELTRRAFTAQELKRIFTSPVYTNKKRPRACGGEAIAWVPLIALASGARLEEICQLRVADISIDSEHGPLLRITDEGEEQTLKTASSRRTIPIHPELVRAGLLDYQEAGSDKGHDRLFPELEPDHDGRRGGTFGQEFSRYLRSSRGCCILDKRVVFHSFRHTFKTLCREAGLSEELHDALTGHASQTVGRSYGYMPLSALVSAVARIRFPILFPRIES